MNTLRDYQKEIVARVQMEWESHRSVMVQMPTGTGKTHVLASIVSSFSGKVLIVAHRVELVEQIRETVGRKLRTQNSELKISSIQAISRRMDSLDFHPNLIIIDEAHHALAHTYRILWEKWPEAKFLGLTATPYRLNQEGFTDLFDTLVSSWSIAEFIQKGVLSTFDYVSIRPDSPEQQLIDSLKKRGADGDYQIKEMNEVLNRPPSIERLYRSIREHADGKKGIVYAISMEHAQHIAQCYAQQGIQVATIDSRTPKAERKRLVAAFKNGDIRVLVNVDIFSEGFDCPDVEFIQMARPTLSLAKYLQQVGRGLRKSHGKASCLLIDNVGLIRTFGLPTEERDWERMFQGELKAWQDPQTGRWGLRRGKETILGARFITMTFARNHFLTVGMENGKESHIDLYNFKTYDSLPEVKRYGTFELLKVNHRCYSRTKEVYASTQPFERIYIVDKGFYLSIFEHAGKCFCLLKGDNERVYRLYRKLEDGSLIVTDQANRHYLAREGSPSVFIGQGDCPDLLEAVAEECKMKLASQEEAKKRRILEEYRQATPYQSGTKWGLRMGERIVVPPIYRHVRQPIGKYCAVEKNYSQWGIISIDGTILVEPNYPEVSIEKDGNALLTQVTGKKIRMRLP